MKDMIIKNWNEYIDIDTTGRNMENELAPWLNDDGALILIENGEDFRDIFVSEWPGLMNDEFGDLFLS